VRRLVAAVLAFLALAQCAHATVAADASRAHESERVLDRVFASRSGLYLDRVPRGSIAYVWPFSQAVAAAIAVASLPDASPAERRAAALRVRQLEQYRAGAVYASRRGGAVFVDDNLWIAQDLLDWYGVSGNRSALATARRLFGFAVTQWDGNAAHPCPGGVYWSEHPPNRDRAAVSTGGAALLGMRLSLLHNADPAFLWWSRRMVNWLDACLRQPSGLYANDVGPTGVVNGRAWSYNQGLVIGADALAARTGDPVALQRAEQIATASLSFLTPAALKAEPPEFVAVLARNLLVLARIDGDSRWRAAVQAYADAAWASARDPATGLFRFGKSTTRLVAQAALTQIYALLAATPDTPPTPQP
jgi:hypothetical protein